MPRWKDEPETGGPLTPAQKMRRHRRAQKLRGLVPAADAAEASGSVVDAALGPADAWTVQPLQIAKAMLRHHEHLRDGKWESMVLSASYHEARLRQLRVRIDKMDPEAALTEVLLFEETTEGLPSSGLVRKVSEARKVVALESVRVEWERVAIQMRRELGITRRRGRGCALRWSG